jgi:anaerobic magnesium-protoporphyrin IX monomethyl ester cyclase
MDPATLKRVGRRPIPAEHQRAIIDYCREKRITTEGFYVFGFLTDTRESISATIDYAIDLGSNVALFKILTPFPGTPLFKHMKHLITEPDWERFDGYTPTFSHPNMTHQELLHLLGSAYCRFYVRPSFGLSYFGIKMPKNIYMGLEHYTRRRQMENEFAFFQEHASKAIDQ